MTLLIVISWVSKRERVPWKYDGWIHQIINVVSNFRCSFSEVLYVADQEADHLCKARD